MITVEKSMETASPLIWQRNSWINVMKVAVTVTNNIITLLDHNEDTKCRFLRSDSEAVPVHHTSRHRNPRYDSGGWSRSDYQPDWANQNEWTKTAEQTAVWFPTPEKLGETKDFTPMQTLLFRDMQESEEKMKLNLKDDTECRTKLFEWFDWTNTLLAVAKKKQAVEDILVEYHDIFARHKIELERTRRSLIWNSHRNTIKLFIAKIC